MTRRPQLRILLRLLANLLAEPAKKINVGGQAVIEGVMMRSPHSFAVAVRTPDGGITVRESPWESLWDRVTFFKWPLLRGSIVLLETLWNGISGAAEANAAPTAGTS